MRRRVLILGAVAAPMVARAAAVEAGSGRIEIAEAAGEMNIVAGSLGTMADAYSNLFNYPKAIETYLHALDIA